MAKEQRRGNREVRKPKAVKTRTEAPVSPFAAKGVAAFETQHHYRDAWEQAADRTPHGSPIELRPEDFRPAL